MSNKVPVAVWAKIYETSEPIADADIIDISTGERWKTGKDGYAHLSVEPGRTLTLVFNKASFPALQSASVIVPPDGLTNINNEITLQVPPLSLYKKLMFVFGKPARGKHHLITTVSAAGKNLHDDLGEGGVVVTLRSADGKICRQDGIYLGTRHGKTEWIRPIITSSTSLLKRFRHKATSTDGGVIFKNVAPGEYTLEAAKKDSAGKEIVFHKAKVIVFKNSPLAINASPPNGPRVTDFPVPPAV